MSFETVPCPRRSPAPPRPGAPRRPWRSGPLLRRPPAEGLALGDRDQELDEIEAALAEARLEAIEGRRVALARRPAEGEGQRLAGDTAGEAGIVGEERRQLGRVREV